MAAIDDYVVTPGGVVDVGGNPVTYDASGNINPTYTTELSPNLSGLTSLLTPFKGIFDRLKSGNTTANDVNAALGVLGLIMPSLNRPQTAGWKGSIDMNKQFTRTPIAQPAYKPYAQSASPVMGRQFFTSTYGAPPAAAPAGPPATPPAEQAGPVSLPASRETDDTAYLQPLSYAPVAAPASAPVAAPAPIPVAAPAAAPVAAPAVKAGIASVLPKAVAAPVAAPAPDLSKYSAWDAYIGNPAFDKYQWISALTQAYNKPGSNLWGVKNLAAPEVSQYLSAKNLLSAQDIASLAPTTQSPGSQYGQFEGYSEYFTPDGQYRRFMPNTKTPISPMRYGPEMGSIAGQVISPYSLPASKLGFTPDQQPKTFASGGLASLVGFAAGGATSNAINVQSLGFGGDKPVDVKALNDLLSKSSGQSLYFPAGTYTLSSTLNIPSNITLMGDGSGKTVFLAAQDYDPKSPLARAEPQGSAININGITFDGGNNARENRSLVELGFVSDVSFANSAVQNTPYTGLDLNGAKNVTVQGSVFTNIGNPEHSEMGGPAIYVGGEGDNQAKNINVVGNTFKDNNWSAAYFMPDGGQFSNNTCVNNGESTLFMNNTGKNVTIANNTIDGSRRMDISASGLELGGQNLKVYGNTISNVGNDGITLTDVSNSQIENNNLFNNGQENTYAPFQHAAGVGVKATAQNSNNVVQNNTIYDNQTTPTQQYGVFGWSQGQGAGWGNSQIANNTMYGNARDNLYDMTGGLQNSFGSNTFESPAMQQAYGDMGFGGEQGVEQGGGQFYQPAPQTMQQPMQQPQTQPMFKPAQAGLAGLLPSEWSGYDAGQKIDWYNQNQVTPDQLLGAGVQQDELDWMGTQGYLGGQQQPAQPMAQPAQPMAQQTAAQPASQPQTPQTPQRSPMPNFQLGQEEQVEAAQGGLMGLARGGKLPPRYLRGQTDGMADKIPSNIDGVQPAKLSHGEFVIPADVVSHLGNGNSDAGAKVLYGMMDRVRKARTGTKKQGKQINPEKFTPGGIAGYAGGGAVAFNTGGTADPTKTPLGTSTETNISSWAGPYVGDMLSKTAALTNAPYQAYQGPMVAGTAPLQSKVFSGLEGLNFPGQLGQSFSAEGAYQLPSMTPGGVTGQQTGPGGIASQYMNPYLSAVLTPQLDELRRQGDISRTKLGAKFGGAGGAGAFSAMGGGRQAIESSELERNLLQEQNKAIGTGYANAYDRAMGQFNVEQGQAKTLADMMAGAGQQQRGIEQEGITALQRQYETELLDPYTKLRFQKEMLQGLPVQTAATTANTSTMGDLKGGLADLQTALKNLGL